MTTILKLGGSVVTQKDKTETVDADNLTRLSEAIAGREEVVVIHGGGSFGHHHASEHGVSTTTGTRDAAAVRAIHGAMKRLNNKVVRVLAEHGAPAVSVHPLSAAARDVEGDLALPTDATARLLAEGFMPVLHGDIVAHSGRGATILSGDEIVVSLAVSLEADRVGLCSAVPGVLDDTGDVIPHIESFDDVAPYLAESDATDVTGGMAEKIRQLLALDAPAFVFGVESIGAFLDGEDVGTRVG